MKKSIFFVFSVVLMFSMLLGACTTPAPVEPQPAVVAPTQVPAAAQPAAPAAPAATAVPAATAAPVVPAEPKVLRFAIAGEPPTLDPHNGADMLSSVAINGMFEGLIRIIDGKVTPGMAESWEMSEDGLTYTFKIRKDAKWADGQPLTAHDFVYGLIRLIDTKPPAPNGSYAFQGFYLVNGEAFNKGEITDPSLVGAKALDDYTLELKLVTPVPYFVPLMDFVSFYPARKDFVEKFQMEFASEPEKIMGNGPFVLTTWNHEQNLVLEKNPNYWNKDSIKLDKVEIYIIGDENTALNMYENGEIDLVNLPKNFIPQYEGEGKALYYGDGVEYWMEFNLVSTKPVGKFLANKNFRHALGYAIDREQFIAGVLQDGSFPALRYTAPMISLGDVKWGDKFPYEYYPSKANMDKANELLDLAMTELGTTRDQIPTIEYLTDDRPDRKLIAEALQDVLDKALGIKLEIKLVQTKQRYQLMDEKNFDIVFAGFGPDYDDPMTYMDRLVSESGLNDTGFANAKYDELIVLAKNTLDAEERAKALFEAEQILMEEGPLVPLYFRSTAWTKSDKLVNITRSGMRADPDYTIADFVE